MMKKIGLVLLAAVLVFGVIVGCKDGGKDPDPILPEGEGDPIPLGLPTIENNAQQKGWATDGVDEKPYDLTIETLLNAKFLVLKLDKAPTGGVQIVWVGDPAWDWNGGQEAITSDLGVPIAAKGSTIEAVEGGFEFKIELSKALKGYANFLKCTKAKLFICYYSPDFDGLGLLDAWIIPYATAPVLKDYTVTFLDVDKATELGKITVTEGLTVDPEGDEYLDLIADIVIPNGSELKWYVLAEEPELWKLTTPVTEDISVYAAVEEMPLYPVFSNAKFLGAGKMKGGEGSAVEGWKWAFGTGDDKNGPLTDIFNASYFVMISKGGNNVDGFGGVQFAFQGDGDVDPWNATIKSTGDWTGLAHTADEIIYFVIDLSQFTNIATLKADPAVTQAQFYINYATVVQVGTVVAYVTSADLSAVPPGGVKFIHASADLKGNSYVSKTVALTPVP